MKTRLLLILGIAIMAGGGVSRADLLSADSSTRVLWNMNATTTENVTYQDIGTGQNQTLSYTVVQDAMSAHDLNLGNKVRSDQSSYTSVNPVYAPTLATGLSGSALQFSRSNGAAQGTTSFNMGTWNGAVDHSLILDAYFEPTTVDATDQTVALVGPIEVRLRGTSSNKLTLYGFNTAGTAYSCTTTSSLTAGTWYHVIATDDGVNLTMKLYTVNATTLAEAQVGSMLTTVIAGGGGMKLSGSGYNPDMIVGAANPYGSSRPFQGLIDDVRVDVVPEPVSILLLGFGGILALRNRKKQA